MKSIDLSVVAPIYNEESCIAEFYMRLSKVLDAAGLSSEILFVDDGSTDRSLEMLRELHRNDPRVRIVSFSRNFGHQASVKAGIDTASGNAIITIDSDLQDPPELIPQLLKKWHEGYDIVNTVHLGRPGETRFKKFTATLFYRLLRAIADIELNLEAGDFKLISRTVADHLKRIPERNLYIRGLTSWLGFRQVSVPFTREPRFAGHTKYSLSKMLRFAWNGITHFSFLPLQLSTYLGFVTLVVCLIWILQALYVRFILDTAVAGWTSIMVAVLFLGGVQLVTLGILGSYVARSYDETRGRPLYVIRCREGFDDVVT